MNRKLVVLLAAASVLVTSGCAVNRAFNKPSPKDLSFLELEADRDTVRAEMGAHTVSSDSAQCDVHAFTEGSGGMKYLRGVTYSLFDLATLGITEIFFNPIEASIGNEKIRLRACYNTANRLQKAERLEKKGTVVLVAAPEAPAAAPAPVVVAAPAPAPEPVAEPAPAAVADAAPAAAAEAPAAAATTAAVQAE